MHVNSRLYSLSGDESRQTEIALLQTWVPRLVVLGTRRFVEKEAIDSVKERVNKRLSFLSDLYRGADHRIDK